MNASELANQLKLHISGLVTWQRGGERAPHKPLLLLLAFGRIQNGEPRLSTFSSIEGELAELLERFGPKRRSSHPEYPFWYLQEDHLWEIPQRHALLAALPKFSQPTRRQLRAVGAMGGLPLELDSLLRSDVELLREVARLVLDGHFPPSYFDDLQAAVGLDLGPTSVRRRDPLFRQQVLRAYKFSCAVCGFNPSLDGSASGLEAAHVRWHSHGGTCSLDNGLCLCALHHKALDLGWISLTEDGRVLVSSLLMGGAQVDALIGRFHKKPLAEPQLGAQAIAPQHARWHHHWVFRKPALPSD